MAKAESGTGAERARPEQRAARTGAGDRSGVPLEELADRSGCSIERVEDIYSRELLLLQRDARIRAFIPGLAMKRVRDALRQENGQQPPNAAGDS